MIPADWIPHRRPGDRELVGYLVLSGDDVLPMNLLGQSLSEPIAYDEAESLLEERGLAGLAGRWVLTLADGTDHPVVITQIDAGRVVLSGAVSGAIGEVGLQHALTLPAGDQLRPA
ncbi:MAG: hypothetical protein L0G99_11285 [Propionibacteriales bacterium]|nr:hypothetical protein [Propionibacteriales bacterium]